jgi:uncharacterized hydrophobic protein (TIGR00341 family)
MLSKRQTRISSKISPEEIHKDVINNSAFNIDYTIFIILSAFTAGFGLILDNVLIVMASMVLAPLMGPILGLSYGIIIRDKPLIMKAAKSEFFGVIISILCGIIIGLLYYLLNISYSLYNPSIFPIPIVSLEIRNRGLITIVDVLLALVIGIATGFSLTGGKFYSSLVGLAVGASLMPPIVNIGVSLVLGEFSISFVSLMIALVNIICINVTAIVIFKIKKIKKPSKIWIRWWRQPKLPEPEKEEEEDKEPATMTDKPKGFFSKIKGTSKKEVKTPKLDKKTKKEIADEVKNEIKEEVTEKIKEELKNEMKEKEKNSN